MLKVNPMNADQFPLTSEELRLLTQIGLLAATSAYAVPAIRLFEGLRKVRPEQDFFLIGLAVARLAIGAFQDAVRILRDEGLRIFPESKTIRVYLSLALFLSKQPNEAQRLLSAIFKEHDLEHDELQLAKSVLLQVECRGKKEIDLKPAKIIELRRPI